MMILVDCNVLYIYIQCNTQATLKKLYYKVDSKTISKIQSGILNDVQVTQNRQEKENREVKNRSQTNKILNGVFKPGIFTTYISSLNTLKDKN